VGRHVLVPHAALRVRLPGTNEDGEEGIWIQSARADRAAVLVTDGDFVA
jgi:hypothetical protein